MLVLYFPIPFIVAWFIADDRSCEHAYNLLQYLYLGIISNMGLLATTCTFQSDWTACLIDDFRRRDPILYEIIRTNKLPVWAPNGNYRGSMEKACR